jgi:hypothetical protein
MLVPLRGRSTMRSNSPTSTAVVKHGHSRSHGHSTRRDRSARPAPDRVTCRFWRWWPQVQGDCAVRGTAIAALSVAGATGTAPALGRTKPRPARSRPESHIPRMTRALILSHKLVPQRHLAYRSGGGCGAEILLVSADVTAWCRCSSSDAVPRPATLIRVPLWSLRCPAGN